MKEFSLAPLLESEFDDAARFLASVFGGEVERYLAEFSHWWEANPRWTPEMPRGWLARSKVTSEPIGFTSNIPFPYIINRAPALCFATGSTAVHPEWRRVGVAKALGQAFVSQPVAFLVGADSSDPALRLWLSLGMQALQQPWIATNYVVLCHLPTFAENLAVKARLPGKVGDIAGRVGAGFMMATELRWRRSFRVEAVSQFESEDADALALCRASNRDTYAFRDPETLNWLLAAEAYRGLTRVALVARSGNQLVGYLLMKKREGHPSYYLLECRCRDADVDIAKELLAAACAFARKKRYSEIIVRPYTAMIKSALPPFSLPATKLVTKITKVGRTTCSYRFNGFDVDPDRWEAGPADGDVAVN